ncbi:MAG: beta-galactosidase [Prevotella sp.]|nr:beta-galactosidase [Prevotella sp.]
MTKILKQLALAALMTLMPATGFAAQKPGTFTTGDKTFLLNGQPFIVKAAEVHYPRIPRPYWEHRIKMCKALGMNAVCIYIFWNIHEQREGQFDFTGNNDVAEFCRIAQKNGLYVIVRPGPYVCAEWEMGGLPWWLLKKKDIKLRERDPYFMERVKIFEEKVGEQLKPLTIQNGGPIIMIQVENEYGSYGTDKPYVSEIRDCLREIYKASPSPSKGGDVNSLNTIDNSAVSPNQTHPPLEGFGEASPLLFQCDWSSNFEQNGLDDLVWTMNFGTGANIDQQFRRLGELRPNAPKMCSEFWSGWFDKWGARHETRPAKDMVEGMDEMLSKGISFSLYMTHGGTSFGHWAGANSPGFAPDVTSYDYDAPINEYGKDTPKFWELRKMMEKYDERGFPLQGGRKGGLPAVPKAPMPIVTVPKFELTEFAPFMAAMTQPVNGAPKTFEEMDMGWGTMMYSTRLPEITSQSVLSGEFHDFAQVFIDKKYIGKIDRVKNEKSLTIPAVKKGAELIIIVEGMGRINFGRAIKDFKGIVGNVTLTTETDDVEMVLTPKQWMNVAIPDDYQTAVKALDMVKGVNDQVAAGKVKGSVPALAFTQGYEGSKKLGDIMKPGYHRGYFTLKKVGDTFLNFETWGKGQVYVNGHAMGRIWSIGPQQTLYVPGCWLKKGKNEIIVLDIVGPKETVVWGQAEPELNKLQLEKSNKHNNIGDKPDLNSATPVATGAFKAGNGWQTIKFNAPQKGRYLAIECLSTQKEGDRAAIAELYLQGQDGKRLSREPWKTKYANSEEENGNHLGDKVFDLQESTYWQTEKSAQAPHLLVIDLGAEQTVSALEYLPRAEQGAPGSVKNFRIFILQ